MKMQSSLLSVVLVVVLVGASGAAVAAPPEDVAALKGQPVQQIVARLGPPDSEQKAGSATTYVWTVKTRVETPTRTTTTDLSTGRPNTYDTMAMRPQEESCSLSVVTDGAGTITDADRQGPYPACAALARKLAGDR
jgi:hypothetical protein